MATKPYKGEIEGWYKVTFDTDKAKKFYQEDVGLGYCIYGRVYGHPNFGTTSTFHTSWVVNHNKRTGMIETRNSRYKLVGKENKS